MMIVFNQCLKRKEKKSPHLQSKDFLLEEADLWNKGDERAVSLFNTCIHTGRSINSQAVEGTLKQWFCWFHCKHSLRICLFPGVFACDWLCVSNIYSHIKEAQGKTSHWMYFHAINNNWGLVLFLYHSRACQCLVPSKCIY